MHKPNVIIDYLSFTWCPDDLAPLRRLAANSPQSFAQFLGGWEKSLVKAYEAYTLIDDVDQSLKATCEGLQRSKAVIDIDFLEESCVEHVLTFCKVISKDFFKGSEEFTTNDAWEELFDMRDRNRGMFGYRKSWDLYLNGTVIGVACAGAKNGGCYISFTGAGCAMIDFHKLHQQIQYLPMIKITRCDPAFDDYSGVYSCDYAEQRWKEEGFKALKGGSNPKCAWFMSGGELQEDGSVFYADGRTFQVGNRKNGKLCRIYEKGKQQGDPSSPWVRWEVEIRAQDREIPLSILIDPSTYFVGFYPVLEELSPVEQPTLIKTQKKRAQSAYKKTVNAAKRSYGSLINVMRNSLDLSDSEIIKQLISTDQNAVPRSLRQAFGAGLAT